MIPSGSAAARELQAEELRRRCDAAKFTFETTADLAEAGHAMGQERAIEALRFGIGMRNCISRLEPNAFERIGNIAFTGAAARRKNVAEFLRLCGAEVDIHGGDAGDEFLVNSANLEHLTLQGGSGIDTASQGNESSDLG